MCCILPSIPVLQAEAARTLPDCTAGCQERAGVCFSVTFTPRVIFTTAYTLGKWSELWTRWLRSDKR